MQSVKRGPYAPREIIKTRRVQPAFLGTPTGIFLLFGRQVRVRRR